MILYLVFLLSGGAGLIYQIVWVREFGNVFGNTIHSAALVIAVFMLGLGVGGWLAGIWADRRWVQQPGTLLAAYARVEIGIALAGLAIALVLPRLGDVAAATSSYVTGPHGWRVLSTGSYLARYAVAVALLTPATLLMGATLTLLIRHVVQRDLGLAGWRIGALYGANTAGAALGCFLTDHALIPWVGLFATQAFAAGLNLTAALVALQLAARGVGAAAAPRGEAPGAGAGAPVAAALGIFLSGVAAMGLEIVWFRHLTSLLGSYRSVISLVLTVILVGIWLGAVAGGWLHRWAGRPAVIYMLAQAIFVVAALRGLGAADVTGVVADHAAAYPRFLAASELGRAALLLWLNLVPVLREIAVPALLMGCAYPLANALAQDAERSVGRRAGALYFANTAGAVLGALAAGFALLPALGMQRTVTVLVAVAMVGLLPLWIAGRREPGPRQARVAATALGLGLASTGAALLVWIGLPADYLVGRTLAHGPRELTLTVSEGLTEVVAVVEVPGQGRALVTNGHSMSTTAPPAQRYMRAFVHLPLLTMEAPERVLVICFGVGNTAHAATLHPTVRQIDVVDTSRQVLEHSEWFAATNGGVLRHPKVSVHVNDGRHHLRMQAPASYDLITLEPPPIAFAGVGSLYSREFYEVARSRLRPGGHLTQWLPIYQVPGDVALAMVRAFVDVFPGAVLLSGATTELILVGVQGGPAEIDPDRVLANLKSAPIVRQDLARVRLETLTELVGTFVAPAATLSAATAEVGPVTDDLPLTEYSKSSRLAAHAIPRTLFDVQGVAAWCPKCFVEGRPRPGLEDLPAFLAVMAQLYDHPSFREYYWPVRPPGRDGAPRLARDAPAERAIAASTYLQALVAAPAPRP